MKRSASVLASAAAGCGALLTVATPSHAQSFITVDYNDTYSDAVAFFVHNTTSSDFTNAQLTATDSHGSATEYFGTIAAGATAQSGYSNPYFGDYDDYYRGEAVYTFTATDGATTVSSTFSPSNNATGGFLDFLGNDANGNEADVVTPPTKVGYTLPPSSGGGSSNSTPEPGSFALIGSLCLTSVALIRRKRTR